MDKYSRELKHRTWGCPEGVIEVEIDHEYGLASVAAIPPGRVSQIFANCPPGMYTCESKIERALPVKRLT